MIKIIDEEVMVKDEKEGGKDDNKDGYDNCLWWQC